MRDDKNERRPVVEGGAQIPGKKIKINDTDPAPFVHRPKRAEVERRAELSGYVIRAVTTMTNGVMKTQHYASLHAAVRAAERAERRGCLCVLSLCRVVPVERVELADLEAVAL